MVTMTISIEYGYDLHTEVRIKKIDTIGLVIGYYYGETGHQYQVAYFIDGERKTIYLYPEELDLPTGRESAGFMKGR